MSEENKENNQQESSSEQEKEYEYDFKNDISAFDDLSLDCQVILGSAKMSIGQFLRITRGSILELEQSIDERLDVLINGYKIAEGEIIINQDIIGTQISKTFKHPKY